LYNTENGEKGAAITIGRRDIEVITMGRYVEVRGS